MKRTPTDELAEEGVLGNLLGEERDQKVEELQQPVSLAHDRLVDRDLQEEPLGKGAQDGRLIDQDQMFTDLRLRLQDGGSLDA